MMPYSITIRTFQTNPKAYFRIVEKGVWHYEGGEWSSCDNLLKLTMPDSGTSGMLRFVSDTTTLGSADPQSFYIAVGVHDWKRWVDIVPDIARTDTTAHALPEYYNNTNPERVKAREAQRYSFQVKDSNGVTISARYTVSEGKELALDLIIS